MGRDDRSMNCRVVAHGRHEPLVRLGLSAGRKIDAAELPPLAEQGGPLAEDGVDQGAAGADPGEQDQRWSIPGRDLLNCNDPPATIAVAGWATGSSRLGHWHIAVSARTNLPTLWPSRAIFGWQLEPFGGSSDYLADGEAGLSLDGAVVTPYGRHLVERQTNLGRV